MNTNLLYRLTHTIDNALEFLIFCSVLVLYYYFISSPTVALTCDYLVSKSSLLHFLLFVIVSPKQFMIRNTCASLSLISVFLSPLS